MTNADKTKNPPSAACYNDADGNAAQTDGSDGGLLSKWSCLGFAERDPTYWSQKDEDKYCVPYVTNAHLPFAAQNADQIATNKFGMIMKVQNKAATTPKWSVSKFVHYAAKLASMDKPRLAELPASNNLNQCNDKYVKSFEVKTPLVGTATALNPVFYLTPAVGGNNAADYYCYSQAGLTWAKNDPIVKNMDGEEFEIMATGTFSLLSLKARSKTATEPESQTVFEASAAIDRAGTRCGATYIQNMTLSGQWVEAVGVPRIRIKAEPAIPKLQALQVNFAGEWQPAASKSSYAAVQEASAKKIVLKLNALTVSTSVDSHAIREAGTKTKRYANFLNVNFGGISGLAGFSVGGLLGRDSHEDAVELPEGCEPTRLISGNDGPRMFSFRNVVNQKSAWKRFSRRCSRAS